MVQTKITGSASIWGKLDSVESYSKNWVVWNPVLFKAFSSTGHSQLAMGIIQAVFAKTNAKRIDEPVKLSKVNLIKTLGASDAYLRKEFTILAKTLPGFRTVTTDKGDVYDPSVVVKALNEYVANNNLKKLHNRDSVWGDIGRCFNGFLRKSPKINRLYKSKNLTVNEIGVWEALQFSRRDDNVDCLPTISMEKIENMTGLPARHMSKTIASLEFKLGLKTIRGKKRTKGSAALANEYDLRPCIEALEQLAFEDATASSAESPKLAPAAKMLVDDTQTVNYAIEQFVEAHSEGSLFKIEHWGNETKRRGATEDQLREALLVIRKAA